MTFAPCGTPGALGLSTITWIARTVIPLLLAPEHGGALPLSQVCSFKVTEPIPGTRIVVLGGGLSLTVNRGVPAHRPWQRWTPGGLREVGVRLCMRYHHVEGVPSRRQASDVNPDHIDGEVGSESPANDLAGCGLGTRPDLLEELDEATG